MIEKREDAVEGVVAGDAVGEAQEGGKPIALDLAEVLHVVKRLAAAEQRTDDDGEDVGEFVMFGAVDPGIGEAFKVAHQAEVGDDAYRASAPAIHAFKKHRDKM